MFIFFFSYLYYALLTRCALNSCLFCHLLSSTWCLCCSHVGTMPFENPIKIIFVLMSGAVLDDDIFCVCVKGCGDTNSAKYFAIKICVWNFCKVSLQNTTIQADRNSFLMCLILAEHSCKHLTALTI